MKTKKAFTLIELITAVALLAMIIAFSSVIFKVSIDANRKAGANSEIMQKLRAITNQLNDDFKGAVALPIKMDPNFENSYIDGQNVQLRSDGIAFFTSGDFQSIRQYRYLKSSGGEGLKTVVGNVAGVYYGLADDISTDDPREKILVRRQTILTSDTSLIEPNDLDGRGEYCNTQTLADVIADPCLVDKLVVRPNWNPDNWDPNDLVMYMAKGVDNFTIQYVGSDNLGYEFNEWRPQDIDLPLDAGFRAGLLALKFTFTLYDSKGIIKKGRQFTHIVYLID